MAAEAGFSLFLSKNIAFCPTVGYMIETTTIPTFDFTASENVDEKFSVGNLIIQAGINIHL